MWSKGQKLIIQKYRAAAGLADVEYRQLLNTACRGAITSKDPRLTNEDFDALVPALEIALNLAICNGNVEFAKATKGIHDPWYFTRKAASRAAGKATERQIHLIQGLATDLEIQPETDGGWHYLRGIIDQAAKNKCQAERLENITLHEASLLIDALSSRSGQHKPESIQEDDYPPGWDEGKETP